jgi:hypothetical protein
VHEEEPAREKELSGQGVHEEEALTEVYVLAGQARQVPVAEGEEEIVARVRLLSDVEMGVSLNLVA